MKNLIKKVSCISMFILFLCFFVCLPVSAQITGDATTPEGIATFLLGNTMMFIGGAMMVFGAIQLAIAFKDEDTGGRTKAMLIVVSGALLVMVTLGYNDFINEASSGSTTISIPNSNPDLNNDITAPIAKWIPALGMIVTFWGAIQLALAMKNDNAGEKVKSLKILVAGVALWQIVNFMTAILGS